MDARDIAAVLASALHERLGSESPASLLPQLLLSQISSVSASSRSLVLVYGWDAILSLQRKPSQWASGKTPALPPSFNHSLAASGVDGAGGSRALLVVRKGDAILYSPGNCSWEAASRCPVDICSPQAVEVGGNAYIASSGSMARYDACSNRWESLRGADHGDCQLAEISGRIYAAGGSRANDGSATDEVMAYDPRSGDWESLAPLPRARQCHGAAACSGSLFVAGGVVAGDSHKDTVERFDPRAGRWEKAAKMSKGRLDLGCAEVCGQLWAIGGTVEESLEPVIIGEAPLRAVERLDPVSGNWDSDVPQLPAPRHNFALAWL